MRRKSENTNHSTFPLMPLLRYLRILGGVPFMEEGSRLRFSIISWPVAYCILVMTFLCLLSNNTMFNSTFYRGLVLGYDQFVRSLIGLIYLSFVFISILYWPNSSAIVRALNGWNKLQMQLDLTIDKTSSSVLLDYPGCCLMVMIAVAIVELIISFIPVPQIKVLMVLDFFFILQNHIVFIWFWILYTHIVLMISNDLKQAVVKAIVHNRGEEVRRCRVLWQQLRTRTSALTNAVAPTAIVYLLLRLLVIVLSLYASAVYKKRHPHVTALPTYLYIPCLRSVLDLVITCECCSRADLQMRQEFKSVIFSCKLQYLSADTQDELQLFLHSVEISGHVFNLKGIFYLSRKTLLSVTSLTLTYITILVQLEQLPIINEE